MARYAIPLLALIALAVLAACGSTKHTMKNCEPTSDPKIFVNCEEVD
jgi:hypothetical protein